MKNTFKITSLFIALFIVSTFISSSVFAEQTALPSVNEGITQPIPAYSLDDLIAAGITKGPEYSSEYAVSGSNVGEMIQNISNVPSVNRHYICGDGTAINTGTTGYQGSGFYGNFGNGSVYCVGLSY